MARTASPGIVSAALMVAAIALSATARAGDPAEVVIGERLFLETRFAQFFAAHSNGDVNAVLPAGDPVVDRVETAEGSVPGPFAGGAINCRACHLVDDVAPAAGSRAYADFARRSPVPAREDGQRVAIRNAPSLVNAALPRPGGMLLHFDGEFSGTAELVRATMTGRNFGWLPAEHAEAVAHVARVVREDDGEGALAQGAGGSYRLVLAGTDPSIPPVLRLPRRFRVDVTDATDQEVLDAVARLVAAYVESLVFAKDRGAFSGSPYDRFLAANRLPRRPRAGESPTAYARRLRRLLERLDAPVYVTAADGAFVLHEQPFVFGPLERDGLDVFLRDEGNGPGVGNCVACHPPPAFTDFAFHNTGASQEEYDALHGEGRFAALAIPDAAARAASPDAFLPATPTHPHAAGPFRAVPALQDPGRADLGLWNVILHPDVARRGQQRRLARLVCRSRELAPGCERAGADRLLADAIGLFKTPGLRDLGHSGPYNHTGAADTLEDVVRFYLTSVTLAAQGRLRNAPPEFARMRLGGGDIPRLAAFLRSLNEDYE